MDNIVAALKELPIFRTVPAEDLQLLAQAASVIQFRPGEVVLERGEEGEHALLLVDGRLSAAVEGAQKLRRVGDIWPGEIVGELGLLQPGSPRSATVRAAAQSTCLLLTRDLMEASQGSKGTLALEQHMLGTMARRLRSTNHAIRMLWQDQRKAQARAAEAAKRAAEKSAEPEVEEAITFRERVARFFGAKS
ncbi:MAG: cyclic nucleotide-binding domain-containing protein [Alphaproteobacteria bacterium]|nr:cyclic nucleotide-binding domain-containing protein [Alphaproteobacteria bacterium]